MNSAVFILSYGRPNKIYTYDSLRKLGYSGRIIIICSDDDKFVGDYKKKYGDDVVVFNKGEAQKSFDVADNFNDNRVVVFARNVCFDVANKLGFTHFVEMDDDYVDFAYRVERDGVLKTINLPLDKVFSFYFDFLEASRAMCVALAQGGDFIGGVNSGTVKKGLLRKIMNVFFCDTKKPFKFKGRINEDVNTYSHFGRQGILLLTPMQFMIVQKQTQANSGGMAELYKDHGVYLKSFYSVMIEPSCVKVSAMGDRHLRIHHNVIDNYAYPKILSERLKK